MKNSKITRVVIYPGQKPTSEQIKEIENASKKDVVTDDDTPELTPEQYAEISEIARKR